MSRRCSAGLCRPPRRPPSQHSLCSSPRSRRLPAGGRPTGSFFRLEVVMTDFAGFALRTSFSHRVWLLVRRDTEPTPRAARVCLTSASCALRSLVQTGQRSCTFSCCGTACSSRTAHVDLVRERVRVRADFTSKSVCAVAATRRSLFSFRKNTVCVLLGVFAFWRSDVRQ